MPTLIVRQKGKEAISGIAAVVLLGYLVAHTLLPQEEESRQKQPSPVASPKPTYPSLAPLTGRYVSGSEYLVLDAKGRFHYAKHGCMGTYDEAEGSVALRNNTLFLSPDHPGNHSEGRPMDRELNVVRWGKRTYLIPPKWMTPFYGQVTYGAEPRDVGYGLLYLHERDWNIPVSGVPDVPPSWQKYTPVIGKVVRLLPDGRAWVDRGAADRVMPHVVRNISGHRSSSVYLKVKEVQEHQSLVWCDSPLRLGQSILLPRLF